MIAPLNSQKKKTIKYPCLKVWKDNQLIVLFTFPGTGVCLFAPKVSGNKAGDTHDWEEKEFKFISPKSCVVLRNSDDSDDV